MFSDSAYVQIDAWMDSCVYRAEFTRIHIPAVAQPLQL
jgi:hypothetical protein